MDLKRLKSVKVMVEKLDIPSLLVHCFNSNKIFNREKTLKNGLDEHQIECSSSNASIDVQRKFSDTADVDADINLQENGIKNRMPTEIVIVKKSKSKSRSFSSIKHSRIKTKRYIDSSDVSNCEIPNFDKCTRSSPILECNYFGTEVNNINSNTVIRNKLPKLSQSLNSFNLSASETLSKFKIHDFKVSEELSL